MLKVFVEPLVSVYTSSARIIPQKRLPYVQVQVHVVTIGGRRRYLVRRRPKFFRIDLTPGTDCSHIPLQCELISLPPSRLLHTYFDLQTFSRGSHFTDYKIVYSPASPPPSPRPPISLPSPTPFSQWNYSLVKWASSHNGGTPLSSILM